ncbi:MAG: hypothetical protein R3185_06960, partial [Candidatus Thermoplasmatota archaeon]|nr:hypothetical protein [Candidatus Thermoplasmatota archaeon]
MSEGVPPWVQETVRYETNTDEPILECQVLKDGPFRKLAVVATESKNMVVQHGMLGGKAWNVGFLGSKATTM